ncbi:hypothetical protein MKZ24_09715 [Paenibacillus sp. FSL R7-0297]|uniref:hypothetical protein n=1 Tax=Paenibacillus sp. FSL R7-0297 TaxID=2921680 RepID=UPI0030F8D7E5
MSPKKFFKALVNGTNTNNLKWHVAPKSSYRLFTNISSGIVDAYFTEYRKDTLIVVYQYKTENDNGEEEVSYYISICDSNFKFKYEFTQKELNAYGTEMFQFYKSLQRSANNINIFMEEFVKDFGSDDDDDLPF